MRGSLSDYVVHSPRALAAAILPPLVGGALFVGFAVLVRGHVAFGVVVGAAVIGVSLLNGRAAWRCLVVDGQGITLTFPRAGSGLAPVSRTAPWSSVRRLLVDPSNDIVRVELRVDAPMPPWLRSRIIDPRDPAGGVWFERRVPGLDPVALETATRTFAPHVQVWAQPLGS